MSIIGSNILAGAAGSGVSAYEIEQSLRFESGDTHYLNRTPGSAGNRKTWTFSCWFKRPKVTESIFFISGGFSGGGATQSDFRIRLRSDSDSIEVANAVNNSNTFTVHGSPKFRDPSAWYHLVVAMDTTQSTASDRVKIWVNGEQITAFATSNYPSLNEEPLLNTALVHRIGAWDDSGSVYSPTSPYLAEMYHVDGTALDHEDFGEYDTNGVWRPIRPTISSYGTTGFYLDFSNSSNLGEDQAGSNDWTANNFTTSGTGTDVMSDTPTTNWCTLNPISNQVHTLSNGNLDIASAAGNADTRCNSTIAVSSGKWYYEVTLTDAGTNSAAGIGQNQITNAWPGNDSLSYAYGFENAVKANNGSSSSYGSALGAGDVFMCAFDLDNNKIFFGKNGTWFDSSDPAAGTNSAYTLAAGAYCPVFRPYELNSIGASFSCNFGQRAFAYTPPTGFNALNTSNLPAPDIADGSKYFNTVLYTGNDGTQTVSGVGFQPDLVWIKNRSTTASHWLNDAVRGAGLSWASDTREAEKSYAAYFTGFNSDGFALAGGTPGFNDLNNTYASWNWLAGNGTSSNTDGSITSTVRANPTAGFSIVSYTGNGSSNQTIGHGLGVQPAFVITKTRDQSSPYISTSCYHKDLSTDHILWLNSTDQQGNGLGNYFKFSLFSSTVFGVGNDIYGPNVSSEDYIAYCFAEVEGYSKFGSYTGNGSSDGPFVYCGFKPAWIMWKPANHASATDWVIRDATRDTYNVVSQYLLANTSGAEGTASEIDILSNGFKFRNNFPGNNSSGTTVVFAAFASHPFGGSGVSPATAR